MMITSTPIPPFALPVPLPRPVIVLLSSTDLDNGDNLVPLLAQDDLINKERGPCVLHQQPLKPRYHHYHPTARINISPCPSAPRAESSPLSSPEPSSPASSNTDGGDVDNDAPLLSHRKTPNHINFAHPVRVGVKMRIPHPIGAGRMPLNQRMNLAEVELQAMKVCFPIHHIPSRVSSSI